MIKLYIYFQQLFCKHEDWLHDTQIRTIECAKCGKRASIAEYVDLFKINQQTII